MSKSVLTTKISLALGLIFAMVLGVAPTGAFAAVPRTTYIVQVKTGFAPGVRTAIGKLGENPHDELTEVMDGFVVDLTDAEAVALRATANVLRVEPDQTANLLDTQSPVPSWGLDRIDQATSTLDNSYSYPASSGSGVRIYIVDTGVQADNPDFSGRVGAGTDLLGQGLENTDCHGHGTHVAGTAAGTKYGVAKKATIIPVRVLNCAGSGTYSNIISAMDWIIANNPAGTPAVVSMSIGGGFSTLLNAAIEKLAVSGITPVVAAGNSNTDACTASPSSAPSAITVGASDNTDARASFSNYGDCVDLFAPGVSIISDSNTDPTGSKVMSGTSMATPHVSGLAALYLSLNPKAMPDAVTSALRAGGQAGVIANAQSINGNILINNNFIKASVPVAPAPINPPTAVTAGAITNSSAAISWTAPATVAGVASTTPTGYLVEYKLATDTTWLSTTTVSTSVTLSGLTSLSNYVVRVSSTAGVQQSLPSAELQFATLGTPPAAPNGFATTAIYGSRIDFAWTAPYSNGSVITGYYLEQQKAGVWTRVATPYGLSYSLNSLAPVTAYSFRLQAYNAFGAGPFSAVLNATTTVATPVAPNAPVISNIVGTTATASWNASPQVDPATPITYTVSVYSRNIVNFGAVLATYTATTNSQVLSNLAHTTPYSVGVVANSGSVSSPASALAIFTSAAVAPGAPTVPGITKKTVGLTLTWMSPADSGGSAVTGYLVDRQNSDGTWTNLATLSATSYAYDIPDPARGTSVSYRISAFNAIGTGAALVIRATTSPVAPTAPLNVTLVRGITSSVISWTAPADNGGNPVNYYSIYRSTDGGTSWTMILNVSTGTSAAVGIPARGVTYTFAVSANNGYGTSPKSNFVTDTTQLSTPAAVPTIGFAYNSAGKLQITWSTPTDNGGSPITAYRLERQQANGSWIVLNESNVLTFAIDRDQPGVVVNIRVSAINALGVGTSLARGFLTPYVKSTAPQNLVAVDNGNNVTLAWMAPANTGGSPVSTYQAQWSRDGGVTWTALVNVVGTQLGAIVARPVKGASASYRVIANTAVGASDFSNVVTITAAKTLASAPLIRGIAINSDGSVSVSWNAPNDFGGDVALTAYQVERSRDNLTWTAVATVAAPVTTATFAGSGPGSKYYVRVRSVNSVGASLPSSVLYVMAPYQLPGAPTALTATFAAGRANLTWLAPTNTGGAALSSYSIEMSSNNGTTWSTLGYSVTNTASVSVTAKGTTFLFRVYARTVAGTSTSSNTASVLVPFTTAGAVRLISAVANGAGAFNLTITAPTDLGGYSTFNYRVEVYVNGVWTQVASGVGSASSVIAIRTPSTTITYTYRVIASNPSGDSPAASFNYRG